MAVATSQNNLMLVVRLCCMRRTACCHSTHLHGLQVLQLAWHAKRYTQAHLAPVVMPEAAADRIRVDLGCCRRAPGCWASQRVWL